LQGRFRNSRFGFVPFSHGPCALRPRRPAAPSKSVPDALEQAVDDRRPGKVKKPVQQRYAARGPPCPSIHYTERLG